MKVSAARKVALQNSQNSFKNRPNSDVLISNLGITANFIYKGSSFIRNVKSRVLNTLAQGGCFHVT